MQPKANCLTVCLFYLALNVCKRTQDSREILRVEVLVGFYKITLCIQKINMSHNSPPI